MWRAVHDRLPTDDKITMFGINIDSRCSCCIGPGLISGIETIEHLFCQGQYAQIIWKYFAGSLGITYRNVNLWNLLFNC